MKNLCASIRNAARRHRIKILCVGFVLLLVFFFLWPRMVISIRPGELGVLYSRFSGGTQMNRTYGEGLHFILPWNILYVYDVRVQEETQNIEVLTLDGLTINVQASLRFQLIRARLPTLHQDIGPRYREKVVIPIMNSSVRQTIGSYRPDDLYATARQQLQDQMLVDAVEEMGRIPILIQGFVVKSITLPEVLRQAIERKLVAEQDYLRYKYLLLEAAQEAKRKAIEGEGIRAYQELINRNMTPEFLRYEGIRATRDLALSTNAKIVVIGGKDGLPVILNTETPGGAGAAAATPQEAPQAAPTAQEKTAGAPSPLALPAERKGVQPGAAGAGSPRSDLSRPVSDRPQAAAPTGPRSLPPLPQAAPTGLPPQSGGLSWIAPGESLTDFIHRLDNTLLRPRATDAVRQ